MRISDGEIYTIYDDPTCGVTLGFSKSRVNGYQKIYNNIENNFMYCFVWPCAVERLITAKYDIFHNLLGLGVISALLGGRSIKLFHSFAESLLQLVFICHQLRFAESFNVVVLPWNAMLWVIS